MMKRIVIAEKYALISISDRTLVIEPAVSKYNSRKAKRICMKSSTADFHYILVLPRISIQNPCHLTGETIP
jgi:hypothetical protein